MDKISHEVRLAQWADVVKQCQSRPVGMSVKAWCNQNGINEKVYFYWQRRVRQKAFAQATALEPIKPEKCEVAFAEVPEAALVKVDNEAPQEVKHTPDVVIRAGNMEIEINNSISPRMLRSILEVISHAR